MHASYLHTHWAGYPHLAARFAEAVHAFAHAAAWADARTAAAQPQGMS
ncbi:MAG: hypothetical protein L0H78_18120 [Humibacillus sp.]|nr:hypothetical protein [Humibacillus sp.]